MILKILKRDFDMIIILNNWFWFDLKFVDDNFEYLKDSEIIKIELYISIIEEWNLYFI